MFAWGDGEFSSLTELVPSGQSLSRSYAWQEPGTYLVQSQARDEHGIYGDWSETFEVVVTDQSSGSPPDTPEVLDAPTFMKYGEEYDFTALTTDSDGDDVKYTFTWDFEGDWIIQGSDFMESGTPCTVSQSFESPGYTRFMTMDVGAVDINGLEGGFCEAIAIEISDPPTDLFITGETSGTAGTEYTYQLRGLDPNFNDLVAFEIDWGDGDSFMTDEVPNMSLLNVSHIWNNEDDYVMSVTVGDQSGVRGPTETLSISISKNRGTNNIPLVIQWLLQRFSIFEKILNQII
jgi:hypothetical protein